MSDYGAASVDGVRGDEGDEPRAGTKRWHLLVTFIVCAVFGIAAASQLLRVVSAGPDVMSADGSSSLTGSELRQCTPEGAAEPTGWKRDGSCAWDASDSGYHEVCVKMSDEFLKASAEKDGNDLSSVVQNGGYWCICAWAWASAVQRDASKYEGLELQCEKSNAKLREVYESASTMEGPTGVSYEAKGALDAVNSICGSGMQSAIGSPLDTGLSTIRRQERKHEAAEAGKEKKERESYASKTVQFGATA